MKVPIYVTAGHKNAVPLQRHNSVHPFLATNGTFPSQNAPFELLLSVCLIYRINGVHYKAVIHLLCRETALYTTESFLTVLRWDAEQFGTGAGVMDWLSTELCTSLLFPGSPKPKRLPWSGGPSVQQHMSSESHVSAHPTEADPVVCGHAGCPHALHKVWWGKSCLKWFLTLFHLQEQSGLFNIILKAWGL